MASKKKKNEYELETGEAPKKRFKLTLPSINGPLVLALVNTLVILSVTGLMAYTRLVFKRAPITESGERKRLVKLHEKAEPASNPGSVQFEPITVNIQSTPAQPKPADGTARQIQGKLHYATVGFALELGDSRNQEHIDRIKPQLMDKMLSMLGRKSFHELTTVQGRYILRSQILQQANQLAMTRGPKGTKGGSGTAAPLVTQVYFTQFIVQ